MKRAWIGLLFAIMLNPTLAQTSHKTSHPKNGPEAGAIQFPVTTARQWTLQDGLTVIVQEDHSAPVASVQAWCQTGSIDEDKHLGAGLSHILEHMLFKGTETRQTSQIAQKIQDAGGYINAYTSYDRTVFWIDIPSKGVETAIDILADAMMNSTLPQAEYVKEQEVIRREFAMGYDNPDRMSTLNLFATAYQEHPYRLPVIGHLEIYDKLKRDDVMEYYKARYVPNNLFFVVAGDVDAEKVHAQLETYFSNYPRRSLSPVYIPPEQPQMGPREWNTEFPTELTRLNLAWHIPQITHPDVPALDLLSLILGDGRSSLLNQKLREQMGLVHGISAFAYAPADPGLFGISAVLDPDKRAATEKEVLDIIDGLKKNGVKKEDLEKAKKLSLSGQLQSLTTMRGKASDLGSNWLTTRNLNFTHDYMEAIQAVTLEDIRRVLATYFGGANRTVTSLNPIGSLKTAGETAAPVSANEIQKFELPNGLRLLVREDKRLPLVSAVAVFKGGQLAETAANNGITSLAARVMLKGTKTRTSEEIGDEIENVGGSISSDAGNNSFSVSVKVMQPDMKRGLEVLSDVLLNATMPEKEVELEKETQLAGLKAEEEQVNTVARNLLRANLFGSHPYGLRANGSPESVSRLTRKDLLDFYSKYTVGRNAVIAVFGDVKAAEVKSLIESTLGKLPPGEAALVKPSAPAPLEKEITVEETRDKQQAMLMVGYLGADMFDPDRYALELIDEASSDLGSRFFIRIREKMGLAYSVGSSQMLGLTQGPFIFYLATSPHKVDLVKTELLDEIAKLSRDGLTPEELSRAKEKSIGQMEIRNQNEDSFAYACALDELYGLGYDHYKSERENIEAQTLENVKRVAGKYFEGKPSVIAIVRPPAAAKPAIQ